MLSLTPFEIAVPKTLLETLNGTSSIYIENPWFKVSTKEQFNKEIGMQRQFNNQNGKSFGITIQAPKVFAKHPGNNTFTSRFNIKYSERPNTMKDFFIRKPYLQNGVDDENKRRRELIFSPTYSDPATRALYAEDEIMMRIDQAIAMATEFVLIGCAFKYVIKKNVTNDRELIEDLCEFLEYRDGINNLSDKYFSYIEHPPLWRKNESGVFSIDVDDDDEKQHNLVELIRKFPKIKVLAKKASSLNDFRSCIFKKNCVIVPSFRKKVFTVAEDKKKSGTDSDEVIMPELAMRLNIKTNGFPALANFLMTKSPTKQNHERPMDYQEYRSLYLGGATEYDKAKYSTCYGCHLFVTPAPEFSLYNQGQPKTIWRVDTLMYKSRKSNAAKSMTFINDSMFDDVNDEEPAVESVSSKVDEDQLHELLEE